MQSELTKQEVLTMIIRDIPFNLSKAAILKAIEAAGFDVRTLFSAPEANPKVKKNGKLGMLTFPLHLSPANTGDASRSVCSYATPACMWLCLHTAGNPAYMKGKEKARYERTRLYWFRRDLFVGLMLAEMRLAIARAEKRSMAPAFRPNATSDIPWERAQLFATDGSALGTLADVFPGVELYDYTKIPGRVTSANYNLTFSLAENNDSAADAAIASGRNVAVVFWLKPSQKMPATWRGRPVIDGDEHDYRPADGVGADGLGIYVGLRPKGRAKKDTYGMVRHPV
jgi:hypothetical protein